MMLVCIWYPSSFLLIMTLDWLYLFLNNRAFYPYRVISFKFLLPIHLSDASNIKNKQFHHLIDCKHGWCSFLSKYTALYHKWSYANVYVWFAGASLLPFWVAARASSALKVWEIQLACSFTTYHHHRHPTPAMPLLNLCSCRECSIDIPWRTYPRTEEGALYIGASTSTSAMKDCNSEPTTGTSWNSAPKERYKR